MPVSDLIQTYQRVVSIMRFLNSLAWVIRGKSNVRHLKFEARTGDSSRQSHSRAIRFPRRSKPEIEARIWIAKIILMQPGFLVSATVNSPKSFPCNLVSSYEQNYNMVSSYEQNYRYHHEPKITALNRTGNSKRQNYPMKSGCKHEPKSTALN